MKEAFWCFVFILGALYFIESFSNNQNVHTSYFLYCSDVKGDVHNCKDNLYVSETDYRVLLENQKVITNGGIMWVSDDCIIFDSKNWQCNTLKHNTTNPDIIMRNGWYSEISLEDNAKSWRTISKIEYTIRSLLYSVRDFYNAVFL